MDHQLRQQLVVSLDEDTQAIAVVAAEGVGKFHKDIRVQLAATDVVFSSDERSADYIRSAWLTQLFTAKVHSQHEAARARLLGELFL